MTEREWAESVDPAAMLAWLRTADMPDSANLPLQPCPVAVGPRRLRLFAVGCVRQVWHLLTDERSRRAVEVAELFADGEATKEETFSLVSSCMTLARCLMPNWDSSEEAAMVIESAVMHNTAILPTYASLLRCVVGSPFRPVTLCGAVSSYEAVPAWQGGHRAAKCADCRRVLAWNEGTVLRAARRIYEERGFHCLPILADALFDAGCPADETIPCEACKKQPDEKNHPPGMMFVGWGHGWQPCSSCGGSAVQTVPNPLLQHLRMAGPHCRGCHVVDLLLGKE